LEEEIVPLVLRSRKFRTQENACLRKNFNARRHVSAEEEQTMHRKVKATGACEATLTKKLDMKAQQGGMKLPTRILKLGHTRSMKTFSDRRFIDGWEMQSSGRMVTAPCAYRMTHLRMDLTAAQRLRMKIPEEVSKANTVLRSKDVRVQK
jgi:hypothetical protein